MNAIIDQIQQNIRNKAEHSARALFEDWWTGGEQSCVSIDMDGLNYRLMSTHSAWEAFRAGYMAVNGDKAQQLTEMMR